MSGHHDLRRPAVFIHATKSLSFDAPMKHAIKSDGGLKDWSVREIAQQYQVSRTMAGLKEHAPKIAEIIESLKTATVDKSLPEAAAECVKWLKEFKNLQAYSSKNKNSRWPLSAISKLLWFARDDGRWTLYDSYARDALNIRSGGQSGFELFYKTLEEAGFDEAVTAARAIRDGEDLAGLRIFPERIIDAHLVLISARSDKRASLLRRAANFEATLLPALRPPLTALADALAGDDSCWLNPSKLKKT